MNKKRIVSLALAAVMTAAMTIPAFAAGYAEGLDGNTTIKFTKYLIMDQDAQVVPDVTFSFSVAAGEPDEGIQAGVGTIATATAKFTKDDSPIKYGEEGANDVPGLTEGYKFVKKEVTFDLVEVPFKEVGVYRYTVTETSDHKEYIENDAKTEKQLDVYVINSGGKLAIGGSELHEANDKSKLQGYSNKYLTYDLTLKTEITGNQASANQYFKYTVKLNSALDGEYTVNLTNADSGKITSSDSYNGSTNNSQITVADGTGTADFYLKGGQSIVIPGLAKGTEYTITQAEVEGYTVNPKEPQSSTVGEDKIVTFTNTKNGVIPTGVMLVVAPFAAMMAVGGAGVYAIARKKKRDENED